MAEQIVLIFDVGTQSTRAMLINSRGDLLAKQAEVYAVPYEKPNVDWAENDAMFYYKRMVKTAEDLYAKHPDLWSQIKALGVTTIRDTVVCVDKDGKPLRKAILWLDNRKITSSPKLKLSTRLILKAVGMEETVITHYRASVCNWIMENEPEIWAKTDKYLLMSAFINLQLVGKPIDSVASVVGHIPFDNKARRWQSKYSLTRPVFDVPISKLCAVVETGSCLGGLTAKAGADLHLPPDLPVYATGSDKACETVGLGCVDSSSVAISFGTTATLTTNSERYVEPTRFLPPYPGMSVNSFFPEMEIGRGYWLISWFKKEFAQKEVIQASELNCSPEELLNKRLHEIPAGCDGLIFQPYLVSTSKTKVDKGAIIGFSSIHTRIHLYRAIIEGINFALVEGMHRLIKRGNYDFKAIRIGGGGSKSSEICQITADMFGLPAIRTQTNETSGIGAAMAVFVGLGVYPDLKTAGKNMVQVKDVFQPDLEQHRIYSRLQKEVFEDVFHRLAPLYQRINDICK